MKRFWMWAVFGIVAVSLAGCATTVRRISTDEVVDLSGRWNDTDSQLVAEDMVKEVLGKPWLANFLKTKSKNPTVIVGTIANKTDEHIAIDTFQKDIEKELTNSGTVEFVASTNEREEVREEREDQQTYSSQGSRKEMYGEQGADFMLKGVINKIVDADGRVSTFYYEVTMELVDLQRNVKVWYGDKKIKKLINRRRARP
jgi:uncharacterized protein (TIGR02722 family)